MRTIPFKTAFAVAAAAAIIGCYIAGLYMRLFGPSFGHWLGLPAFIGGMMIVFVLEGQCRRRRLRPLIQFTPAIERARPIVWNAMVLCILIAGLALITMMLSSLGEGVTAGVGPIFAFRPEYQLCSHGVYTNVTRARYLVVGTSLNVGWHAFGMFFALLGLHLVLYGHHPPAFGEAQLES